jgi:hypothetical protein
MIQFLFKSVVLPALVWLSGCGEPASPVVEKAVVVDSKTVPASCGTCNFGLKGDGCSMAVKIGEKAYFVDGIEQKHEAEMHQEGGICVAVREAKVSGEVKNGRFVASSLDLLPYKK